MTALRQGFGISERRACEVVGQPRSSERRITKDRSADRSVAGSTNPPFQLPTSVSA